MTRSLRTKALAVLAAIAIGAAVDQAAKALAVDRLAGRPPVRLAGGFVELRYAENPGALLGLGAGLTPSQRRWIFTIAQSALLAALAAYTVFRSEARDLELSAVALVAAGGVGNLIDRVRFGFVRDYLRIGVWRLEMPAFNVADVAVAVGGTLMLVHLLSATRSRR